MRKIETQMIRAINTGKDWDCDNTSVTHFEGDCTVRLHGNRIAYGQPGRLVADAETLARWPTNTTRSRLRVLGFNAKGSTIIHITRKG